MPHRYSPEKLTIYAEPVQTGYLINSMQTAIELFEHENSNTEVEFGFSSGEDLVLEMMSDSAEYDLF